MITIIGTGHVFNLAEPVSFIVKNTWPDAVLIELDVSRYNALMKAQDEGAKPQGEQQMSAIYKQTARYQQRMSEEYDTQVGGEFLAAVNTGRLAGAAIIPIDTNAMQVLNDMWSEMSAMEKIRYKMSGISDSIGGKRKVESVQTSFAQDEERYIEGMRRKYPTLVRKLIDERNAHMAEQINKASETYSNMVVVVGDAHVEGICKLLKDQKVRKIRLADLRDRERMDRVREMVWHGQGQGDGLERGCREMIVKLLAYTPNADAICAAAGNSCYSERPSYEIAEDINAEKVLSRIVGMGHHSVIEHAVFTFSVKGVSRALTHQLVRHRVHSPHRGGGRGGDQGVRRHHEGHLGRVLEAGVHGDPGGGCQVPSAQRMHHQHHDNHERPRAPALLLAQVLQQGTVGDQGAGGQDAGAMHGGLASHLQERGPAVRPRSVPGGQAVVREAKKMIPVTSNVPCDRF